MSNSCQVKICKNNSRKTNKGNSMIHYFRFPKSDFFKEKWTQATGVTVISAKNPRICSIHFSEDCYVDDWIHKTYNLPSCPRRLKHDAIPTLHLQEKESTCTEASQPLDSAVVMKNNEDKESGRSTQNTWTSSRGKAVKAIKLQTNQTTRKCIRKDCQMKQTRLKRYIQLKLRQTEARHKIQMEVKQKQLEEMTERYRKEEAAKVEWQKKVAEMEEKRK